MPNDCFVFNSDALMGTHKGIINSHFHVFSSTPQTWFNGNLTRIGGGTIGDAQVAITRKCVYLGHSPAKSMRSWSVFDWFYRNKGQLRGSVDERLRPRRRFVIPRWGMGTIIVLRSFVIGSNSPQLAAFGPRKQLSTLPSPSNRYFVLQNRLCTHQWPNLTWKVFIISARFVWNRCF